MKHDESTVGREQDRWVWGKIPGALGYEHPITNSNQPLLLLDDPAHSQNEARHHALGKTGDGRLIQVTFTLRNKETLIRVISARDMHRKERGIYEQTKD